jgi:hypothetical protein
MTQNVQNESLVMHEQYKHDIGHGKESLRVPNFKDVRLNVG